MAKYNLLLEVHINNASTYSNSTYGIVDGVMYYTTGQQDFTYNTNDYLAHYVHSFGRIENSVDVLGSYGGYKPFNEFDFTIRDEGLSQILLSEGYNLYRAQVVCRVEIDNSVYDAYYGCIDNVSTTGNKLRIISGDISLLKESSTLPPFIAGKWDDSITNRNIDLSQFDTEISNNQYALIYCGTNKDPADNTESDYENDLPAYQTLAESVGFSSNRDYVIVYAETAANIATNPNVASESVYQNYFEDYNLEILDDKGEVSRVIFIDSVVYDSANDDRMRVETYGDTSDIEPAKTKVRFARADVTVGYSSYDLNSPPLLEGNQESSILIENDETELTSGTWDRVLNETLTFGNDNGKIPFKIYVPSTISTSLVGQGSGWTYNSTDLVINDEDQVYKTLDTSNKVGDAQRVNNDFDKYGIVITYVIDTADIPEGDWNIGFNINTVQDVSSNDGYSISDQEDIVVKTFTLLNGDVNRPIELDSKSVDPTINEEVFRLDDSGTYAGFIGSTPIPFDNVSVLTREVNAVYSISTKTLAAPVSKEFITDSLTVQIAFSLDAQSASSTGTVDIYAPTFFFYQENLDLIGGNVEIKAAEGVAWSTDSKYTSGASDIYPRTRTEIARYILDQAGLYTPADDYENDIFLPTTEDSFTVAYDNYDKTESNCVALIDDVLTSSNFMLLGDNLGRRKMFNTYELANTPASTVKTITGSLDDVKINGVYDGVGNSYELSFDGEEFFKCIYNSETGDVESSGSNDYNTTSATALEGTLNDSVWINTASSVEKIDSPYTNFGEVSNAPAEVSLLADVYAWPHYKFTLTIDMEDHLSSPVYIGQWIVFKDLKYTNDINIYGLVQGVQIDPLNGKVSLNCISESIKPPASVLDEQNGGNLLDEQIGGVELDEQ